MTAARASADRAGSPPSVSAVRYILAVKSGPDRGAVYELLPPRASIGRGSSNDVALTDPRCSRSQCVIDLGPYGAVLKDVSDKGGATINGAAVREASLRNGDVIGMGDTAIEFRAESAAAMPASASNESTTVGFKAVGASPWGAPASAGYRAGPAPELRRRSPPRTNGGSRARFYAIAAAVAALLVWLLSSSPKEKRKNEPPPTAQKAIDDAYQAIEALRKARDLKPEERERFLEADRHYKEGFRDLQDGQYDRAAKAFETALAIYRGHELATFYRKRALDRREELIAGWMDEGRRFRENLMFGRCSAAMEKVVKAIPDPQDLRRKEADALRAECEERSEAN